MAGLQRFITYINKYDNDEKMDNSGFAKIEIRGSVCRMEVHIRNMSLEQTEATVYLFARDAEIIQGIPVGSMEISRGSGDVRYAFDTKEMQNFGRTMGDMQGIFIPLGDNSFLASQWKEGSIAQKNFRILENQETREEAPKQENQTAETMADIKTRDENAPEYMQQQQSTAEIARQEKKRAEDAPGGQQDKEVTTENGFTIQKDVPSGQAGVIQQRENNVPDAAGQEQIRASNQPQSQQVPQAQRYQQSRQSQTQRYQQVRPQSQRPQTQQSQTQETSQAQTQSSAETLEDTNIHATELPLEEFLEETGWERVFHKLRLKSEICFPFEGEEIECVRMNLNDLREFPQKYWYLGKNSFLLHGFFNYRHILFGEMNENGKKVYFLGIPGVFQNQERLMASMFGFPGFRTAKAAKYKTGNFGYWYRII